jgi:uncharacterized protein YndB with AHSA1/START domain
MRAENGRGTVRTEDVYDTAVADLWSALTEPDRLSRWIVEVSGGWDGPGRIDVCETHRHLLATMSPGSEDETVIEATLTDEAGKTRLVIEERGLPLEAVAAHGAGWQAHIEDLASYLAGREAGSWVDRWTVLTPPYRKLAQELT